MKTEIDVLKQLLGLELSDEKTEIYEKYKKCFLEKNAHTNLISN